MESICVFLTGGSAQKYRPSNYSGSLRAVCGFFIRLLGDVNDLACKNGHTYPLQLIFEMNVRLHFKIRKGIIDSCKCVTPDIALTKPNNQLPCMTCHMACHHD